MQKFIRTCQSCGAASDYKPSDSYKDKKSEAWRNVKCKRCKSDDLDYGSYKTFDANGKEIIEDWTSDD